MKLLALLRPTAAHARRAGRPERLQRIYRETHRHVEELRRAA